jgi:predicted HicB family RNase H-like nuclease
MTTLSCQGYQATITYDADANLFHGEVANLRDVITFQARSEADLPTTLAESIEDYRAFCKARSEAPQQP